MAQVVVIEEGDRIVSVNDQQVVVVRKNKSNGMGTAGFVLSLLSLILFWAPALDVILSALGLLFSIIGLFKSPRGKAVAGLIMAIASSFLIVVFLASFYGRRF